MAIAETVRRGLRGPIFPEEKPNERISFDEGRLCVQEAFGKALLFEVETYVTKSLELRQAGQLSMVQQELFAIYVEGVGVDPRDHMHSFAGLVRGPKEDETHFALNSTLW